MKIIGLILKLIACGNLLKNIRFYLIIKSNI